MKDEQVKKTSGMKAANLDDLTADYKQLGVEFRRQLSKQVIFKDRGPWASIAFKFQARQGNAWQPPRVMLAFFKKMGGLFTRYSYFNIRSKDEAVKIIYFLIEAFDIKSWDLE
jgi:hypothetical protein